MKMKKSLVFILIFAIVASTGCTIAPKTPSDGIWYCKELMLVIEFEEDTSSVRSYDEKLFHMDLQLRAWIDGGFDIVCQNNEEQIVEIYSGWRKKVTNDKFIIDLYSKADPADHYKSQIELKDEEYTFVKIGSYDEINKQQ